MSLLYKNIRLKRIKVNSKRADISYVLKEGDLLELYINDEFFSQADKIPVAPLLFSTADFEMAYEDANILIADKKPGLVVHPDNRSQNSSLIDMIRYYLYEKGEYDPQREHSFAPALCNRIDRNTGGLVIVAKNAAALREMNEKIKERQVTKKYICAVFGSMEKESGLLTAHLKRDMHLKKVDISHKKSPEFKEINTSYEVLEQKSGISLLEVTLITGRTHQIRAHLAASGNPVIGDPKYGDKIKNIKYPKRYQALYAYKLSFDFSKAPSTLAYLHGLTVMCNKVDFIHELGFQYKFEL